jgi:hypothetical protein
MPPKRKIKDLEDFENGFNKNTQPIDDNFDNLKQKFEEMEDYMKKKYKMTMPIGRSYYNGSDPAIEHLASVDKTFAKYKKQLEVLDDYYVNSIKQSMKRNDKEFKDISADIIKRNIKQYIAKKKGKAERSKLIKERNEAATKIQQAFQNSKSQTIRNLPRKAKQQVEDLKGKMKKKPETAAEKARRLKKTAKELADKTYVPPQNA